MLNLTIDGNLSRDQFFQVKNIVKACIHIIAGIRRKMEKKEKQKKSREKIPKESEELGIKTGIKIDHNTSPLYYHRLSNASSDFKLIYDSGWIDK